MVSIWILDKRSMAEGGASPAEIEAAAETARRDASALARLKHPAVVKVWQITKMDIQSVSLGLGSSGASAADFKGSYRGCVLGRQRSGLPQAPCCGKRL